MPATPTYGFRYPAATDPADVPLDMQELATDVEAALKTLAYAEATTVATITATSEATAQAVVTAPAITLDGATVILVEFSAYAAAPPTGGPSMAIVLFDGATPLGQLAYLQNAGYVPIRVARRLTPAAATHTYSIRAWVSSGSGTIHGGAGGSNVPMPAFIRIARAA
jgi:hypothetical protein